jgi:hypothetical protein
MSYIHSNNISREVFHGLPSEYCLSNEAGSVCSDKIGLERTKMSRAHVGCTNSLNACLNVAA